MEKYSYTYAQRFSNPNNINAKLMKYNRNKSVTRKQDGSLYNLNSYKLESTPKAIKQNIKKKYNIINNSPISTKTTNPTNQNFRNLKIFNENSSFYNRDKLATLNSHQDNLNNSLYTSHSRMNKSSKNFYPSSKIGYINLNNRKRINDVKSMNSNIKYLNNNLLNNSLDDDLDSLNYKNIRNNNYIKMTNNNIRHLNQKSNENINKYINNNKINNSNNNYSNLTQNTTYIKNVLSVKDNLINQLKKRNIYLNKLLQEKEKQIISFYDDNNNIYSDSNLNDNIASINLKLTKLHNEFDTFKKEENIPFLKNKNQELLEENIKLNKKIQYLINNGNNNNNNYNKDNPYLKKKEIEKPRPVITQPNILNINKKKKFNLRLHIICCILLFFILPPVSVFYLCYILYQKEKNGE